MLKTHDKTVKLYYLVGPKQRAGRGRQRVTTIWLYVTGDGLLILSLRTMLMYRDRTKLSKVEVSTSCFVDNEATLRQHLEGEHLQLPKVLLAHKPVTVYFRGPIVKIFEKPIFTWTREERRMAAAFLRKHKPEVPTR